MRIHLAASATLLSAAPTPRPLPSRGPGARLDLEERPERAAAPRRAGEVRSGARRAHRRCRHRRRISDFTPGRRQRQAPGRPAGGLRAGRTGRGARSDPNVNEDLAILIEAGRARSAGPSCRRVFKSRYLNLPRLIFGSVRALLDPQIAADRRPAALVRVRKYAGLEPGYPPVVQLVEAEAREGLQKGLLPPAASRWKTICRPRSSD